MESTYRTSSQDKVRYVRGELACFSCVHIFWSNTEYKEMLKPSLIMKSLELRNSDNTGVKEVKTSTEHLPSRWPRNTDLVHTGKCKASIRNAAGHKYGVEEQKFTWEKEQERKLKHYKPSKVQPFISVKDVQPEQKQQDDEIYLDTALENILTWSAGCFNIYSRNDSTSAKNSRYVGNDRNYLHNIYSNCNPSESGGIRTNQSTKFSQECTDNVACVLNICHESYLSIENASLDCQYTSSTCTNSLQSEESGRFSSLKKPIYINRQRDLLCTNTNNTKSAECDSSEKLVMSGHFKSIQINLDCQAKSHSDQSGSLSESVNFLRFGSLLLDSEGQSIRSIQPLVNSCKSNSLENTFYSAQSKLLEGLLQIQSRSIHTVPSNYMVSPSYSPEEFNAISIDGCSESQFSSQLEFSHSDTLQKGPYRDRLISPPAECIEISELPCSKHKRESCFSTHVESCQSDSFNKSMTETSLFESSKEAVYVMPDASSNCDKEMESITFRHLLSNGQRQPEMQSLTLYQPSDVSVKSHDLVFFKTTNSNLLLKSKLSFDDSTFEKGHKTGRFNMATTEPGDHEKPHLLRPEVTWERIPRQINVQNRVYFWHQMMQLYFTLPTALSFGGSLKWLFQLRPVTLQALQKLQSKLYYPFTNLNEFFNCESRESPASAVECMSVEWMRLQTFQNYPVTAHGSPIRLAREGFFYTGQGTQTRCFSCGVSHGEWKFLDNPHEVHQRLSPNCPFLNGRQEGHRNIPLSPDRSGDVGRAGTDSIPPPSLPIAPLPGSGTGQGHAEGNGSLSTEVPSASKITAEDDKILPQQNLESGETSHRMHSHSVEESAQSEADNRPKFPEHVPLPSRIATFSHGWPPYLDQTPQQMAEAGFFFTGNQDYTRCYQCGGGLRNWEPGDNPWIEHCRWYPTCPHVEKGKGQRFVKAVLKKQAELLATQRAECRRKAHYGIGTNDPLETLAAITLLEMGYPRDSVRNSILVLRRQKEPGAEITALEVLDFIWKEEDIERQRQEEEASRHRRPGDAQPPALPTLMERLNLGGSPAVTQAAVQQSASITTSTSSITTAVITTTSATLPVSSASGTSNNTSVSISTAATGATQSSKSQGQDTSAGGHGNTRGRSMQRDGMSKGSVGEEIAAQNQEGSEQGGLIASGAVGGQSNALAVAALIDEDEEFHSLEPEEMENRDYGELEEENKRLKEQTTCKICMENPISVIFLPCGHLVCCEPCAPAFRKCPICRKRIQQSIKTYL